MLRRCEPASPFKRFNSSPEVIRFVVIRCVRFSLSLRNVDGLLDGTVTNISRDAIDQAQQPAGSVRDEYGRPIQPGLVYAARIELSCEPDNPERHALCDRIQPGMSV